MVYLLSECCNYSSAYFFQIFDFTADDLQDMGEIGRGAFGTVNKMRHVKSDTIMAVKVWC